MEFGDRVIAKERWGILLDRASGEVLVKFDSYVEWIPEDQVKAVPRLGRPRHVLLVLEARGDLGAIREFWALEEMEAHI